MGGWFRPGRLVASLETPVEEILAEGVRDRTYRVTITCSERLGPGMHTTSLRLHDREGELAHEVPVRITIPRPIRSVPELIYGKTSVGDVLETRLLILSEEADLRGLRLASMVPEITVEFARTTERRVELHIAIDPEFSDAKEYSADLRFETGDERVPFLVVPVKVARR